MSRRATAGLLLSAALVFAAAACGGDDDDGQDGRAAGSTASAPGVAGTAVVESDLAKKINEAHVPEELADGKRIGSADAAVKIEAYEDFGCPHCLDFTADIEPVIFEEYVATGKVSFEYKYFPLREATGVAAIAAQCSAEQDKFWAYHRALFIAQAEANAKVGPPVSEAFGVANLEQMATDVGLDTAAWKACFTGDTAVEVVETELRAANNLGLPGTPSFVINGKVTQTPDNPEDWRELLDELLE